MRSGNLAIELTRDSRFPTRRVTSSSSQTRRPPKPDQSRKRDPQAMTHHISSIFFSVIVGLLLVSGCAEGPVGPRADQVYLRTDAEANDNVQALRLFTGRDSFGLRFKARVSGMWVQTGDCFDLTGSGNATHLGRINTTQSICVDGSNEVTESSFTFTGQNGRMISGESLFGSVEPAGGGSYNVVLKDTITGGSVPATQIDPEKGKADVTGTLRSNGTFRYRLDGWLLHHLR